MRFSFTKTLIPDMPADLLHVGTIHDGAREHPLIYRGRTALLMTRDGLVEVERDVINPIVAEEIADRARDVCGQMWPDALAIATGIDRRRLTGVRFSTSAIPPRCLAGLGKILSDPKTIKAIGSFVLAMGYLIEADIGPMDFQRQFERAEKIFELTRG